MFLFFFYSEFNLQHYQKSEKVVLLILSYLWYTATNPSTSSPVFWAALIVLWLCHLVLDDIKNRIGQPTISDTVEGASSSVSFYNSFLRLQGGRRSWKLTFSLWLQLVQSLVEFHNAQLRKNEQAPRKILLLFDQPQFLLPLATNTNLTQSHSDVLWSLVWIIYCNPPKRNQIEFNFYKAAFCMLCLEQEFRSWLKTK